MDGTESPSSDPYLSHMEPFIANIPESPRQRQKQDTLNRSEALLGLLIPISCLSRNCDKYNRNPSWFSSAIHIVTWIGDGHMLKNRPAISTWYCIGHRVEGIGGPHYHTCVILPLLPPLLSEKYTAWSCLCRSPEAGLCILDHEVKPWRALNFLSIKIDQILIHLDFLLANTQHLQ